MGNVSNQARTQKDLREKLYTPPEVLENCLNVLRGLYGNSNRPAELSEDQAVTMLDKALFPGDYEQPKEPQRGPVEDAIPLSEAERDGRIPLRREHEPKAPVSKSESPAKYIPGRGKKRRR